MEFDAKLKDVATKLADYAGRGETEKGLNELYAKDAVSVEALGGDDMPREASGLDAIKAKHDWWNGNFEEHESSQEGPFLHGDDRFSMIYRVDVTDKNSGQRMKMTETGTYYVKDGKIVREEFFYQPQSVG